MIFRHHLRRLVCALCIAGSSGLAPAQDNGALISALIRKGILTHQEAEDIRADLVRESKAMPASAVGGARSTERISVGMRLQTQYANIGTEIRGNPVKPAPTDHFFLRRMYLTLRAGVGGDWGAAFTYDFAGGGYDEAVIEWRPTPDLTFNFGLRKVNLAYEERASSGNIKAIERSTVTRYFVESNNGRRLGAASYRIGAFLDGRRKVSSGINLVYSAAITSPERNETFAGASSAGDATSNHIAFWGNVGLSGTLANGTWIAGVASGFLPDQGGFGTTSFGRGYDTNIYSAYSDLTFGRFSLLTEYLAATVERGASPTADASPAGFYFQPSFLVTDSLEAVVRYAWIDSDHRGVGLSDVLRSAPAGGPMNELTEWYGGGNLYLRGNDLKFQLGVVYGKTRKTVTGAPAEARALGVRSQMQIQF